MKITNNTKSIVNNYLRDHFNAEATPSQIRTLTKAAFSIMSSEKQLKPKEWKKTSGPSEEQIAKLESAIEDILITARTPWNPELETDNKVQNLFFNVLRGNAPNAKKILKTKGLLRAVAWKKNPELLKEARELLQTLLSNMIDELQLLPPKDAFHMEIIIGDLLSLYPFLNPEQDEELQVPLLIDGEWRLHNFQVEKIKMTPSWMGSPLVALGMKPMEEGTPPLLLFKGTTYPTDEGFGLSLLTDLNPFASVGAYAFKAGRKKIEKWLRENAENMPAHVYGKSLGGAQAWRCALNFPEHVKKVMAYGAPGLSIADSKKQKALFKTPDKHPEINLFCQEGDPVPYFDKHVQQGFNYYQILGAKKRRGGAAHADMYATHKNSLVFKLQPSQVAKRWRRITLTALRGTLSLFLFPVAVLGHALQTSIHKIIHAARKRRRKAPAPD